MSKLIEASYKGQLDIVKHLIENGADIHVNNDRALRCAINNNHLDVVKHLVECGADIHACNDQALRWASSNGHLDIVKYLIECDADIHARDDEALRWASHYGHFNVVHYLKNIYLERYKEKFLCYDCLVLACCTKLCSNILIKSED